MPVRAKMRGPGDHYGCHRSLVPKGSLPQPAEKLDASLPIYDNEILIDVERLNIDAASFHEIKEGAHGGEERIRRRVLEIVERCGKLHNPVTNSGGMLLGTISEIGSKVSGRGLSKGDRVATLVSLTLTPLHLTAIEKVEIGTDQVVVRGHAILFESAMAHRIPQDLPEGISLAVLDVCGAPALAAQLAHVGETAVILGAGKAGVLVAAELRKKVGKGGKIFLLDKDPRAIESVGSLSFVDQAVAVDAMDPMAVLEVVNQLTGARMADLVINCANVSRTEAASILAAKRTGRVLFFNMATSFQTAVLAAEGIAHETRLIMGNGYTPGHADLSLNLLREFPELRGWFEKRFGE